MDSGASDHLIGKEVVFESDIPRKVAKKSVSFETASGTEVSNIVSEVFVDSLDSSLEPWVLDQCPGLISVGKLCTEKGMSFIWPKHSTPFIVRRDGLVVHLKIQNCVPCIDCCKTR